uniref:C-type lectin domain-containing protein n=1 Tax=Biomphalaria glabrata TaxID=6526 RepID=A0A2C9LUC5_BIOGL
LNGERPEVSSLGAASQLTVNCTLNNFNNEDSNANKTLTFSRYNESKQQYDDLLKLDLDSETLLKASEKVRLKEKVITLGHLIVSLSVQNPLDGDEYRCDFDVQEKLSSSHATWVQIHNVEMSQRSEPDVTPSETCFQSSETKALADDQENVSDAQLRTDRQSKHRAGLVLSVSPLMLVNTYTDTLELMCKYKNSPFVNISSMSILHSLSLEKPEFKYIYSVNTYNNKGQSSVSSLKNASGAIDSSGESFLKLIIDDQTVSKIGLYKCEVIGFDVEHGKPVLVSRDVVVKASKNVLDSVIEIFEHKTRLLKESLELLHSKRTNNELDTKEISLAIKKLEIDLNKSTSQIRLDNEQTKNGTVNMKKLNDELRNNYEAVKKTLDEVVAKMKKFETDPKSLFQKSLESLFIASDVFRGRRYWLTRKNYKLHIADAHSMCLRYGGYLVEIDSQDEFNFVRAFLQKNKIFYSIFTGGIR